MSAISTHDTDVLILCGGRGNRFQAVRKDIPKCLAPIRGRAFLDHLLDNLLSQGFGRFILATGYLGDQIDKHLDQRQDAEYVISREPEPLGTGGAIKFAEPLFQSETILGLNGDSFIEYGLQTLLDFHQGNGADISILLSSATRGLDYGAVELGPAQKIIAFQEKPEQDHTGLTNAGVYCLNTSVLETLKTDQPRSLEWDCLPAWVSRFNVMGLVTGKVVCDIGTSDRYFAAQKSVFTVDRPDLLEKQ